MSLSADESRLPLDVKARDLVLQGPRGPVYGPLDLDIPAGWLIAVVGREGSGRTSLLLTLSGRMRPTSGSLEILGTDGLRHARRIQRRSAVACFSAIDALDEGLRLRELIHERADFSVPLWRRAPRLGDPAMTSLIECVFGDAPFDPDAFVWQLSTLDRFRLRILLALIASPELLVVDDVDTVRRPADQGRVWWTLQRVCERGITVIAASTSATAIPGDVRVVRIGESAARALAGDVPPVPVAGEEA